MFVLLLLTLAACHRHADPPAVDSRNACERGLGQWTGDDVDTRETDPGALTVARNAVRTQHWRITENTLESIEGTGRPTREALRVVLDSPERCDVELTLGDRSRRLNYALLADGRLRVGVPGGSVAMVLRRDR